MAIRTEEPPVNRGEEIEKEAPLDANLDMGKALKRTDTLIRTLAKFNEQGWQARSSKADNQTIKAQIDSINENANQEIKKYFPEREQMINLTHALDRKAKAMIREMEKTEAHFDGESLVKFYSDYWGHAVGFNDLDLSNPEFSGLLMSKMAYEHVKNIHSKVFAGIRRGQKMAETEERQSEIEEAESLLR